MTHNLIYKGSNEKKARYNFFPTEKTSEHLIVFVHGYMGYKDWGAWNLLAKQWCNAGYTVATLNLTHNGTTLENPTQFVDLETFSKATYSKDLSDIANFLDLMEHEHGFRSFILVGHSRGGALVLIAGQDARVKQIHCLAPISSFGNRFPTGEELEKWKKEGVFYRKNTRTQQNMPHSYEQYIDFQNNKEKLDVLTICSQLKKNVFVYHGTNDSSVAHEEGRKIAATCKNGHLYLIENADHTFGAKEPWTEQALPTKLQEVSQLMLFNFAV